MSNQGARQASVRAVTGTTYPYEGDWHALFDMAGIPAGTYNERLLAWINDYMGESFTELNGAMASFAQDQGYSDWNSMGTFDAAGFSPADIPDLSLWLDASDTSTITQVAGLVSQWSDKSGNGNNATQATGANQPETGTQTLNGLNLIRFVAKSMSVATLTVPQPYTMIFVSRDTGSYSGYQHYYDTASGAQSFLGKNTSDQMVAYCGTSLLNGNASTNPTIHAIRANAASTSYSRNGTQNAAGNAGSNGLMGLRIGERVTGGQGANFDSAEILLYSRLLADSEINQIGAYINNKWGISWTNI